MALTRWPRTTTLHAPILPSSPLPLRLTSTAAAPTVASCAPSCGTTASSAPTSTSAPSASKVTRAAGRASVWAALSQGVPGVAHQ